MVSNLGLGTDLLKSCIERSRRNVVDDLSVLHGLAGCHVHAGHVPVHVGIANYGDETRHLVSPHTISERLNYRKQCCRGQRAAAGLRAEFGSTIEYGLLSK